jgi:hypothetical protein
MFDIQTNEEAIEIFSYFFKIRNGELGKIHTYIVNINEEIYEKYGDEEAKKYYDE